MSCVILSADFVILFTFLHTIIFCARCHHSQVLRFAVARMSPKQLAEHASHAILEIFDNARNNQTIKTAWSLAVADLRIHEDVRVDADTDQVLTYSRDIALERLFKRLVIGMIRYQASQWMMFFKSNHLGLVSASNQSIRSILKGHAIDAIFFGFRHGSSTVGNQVLAGAAVLAVRLVAAVLEARALLVSHENAIFDHHH
jgi:hypothetical protein